MEKQEFRTHLNQRVRLRGNGEDSLYSLAAAGSEGWVRAQKYDPLGYPLVQIEWDRNHWTYNGEADKWTFESHFDPIEEKSMSDLDPEKIAQAVVAALTQQQSGQTPTSAPEAPKALPSTPDEILADLAESFKCVEGGEHKPHAYVLIALNKVDEGVYDPHVHSKALSAEASHVLQLYLAKLGFLAHQDLVNLHVALGLSDGGPNES